MTDSSENKADLPPVSGSDPTVTRSQRFHRGLAAASEFEGYKILEELPRGGQALVYKVLQKTTRAKVVLKVLAPGSLGSAKARQRFEREVDFISGLDHPYIVRIRNSGISSGQYYYTMDYIRGLPLDQHVASHELSVRQIMALFLKICDAMAYAHQQGVIHRDLKPSNILVDQRGDPHVLDFGLAKAAGSYGQDMSLMSATGEVKGTYAYMSPEQAAGKGSLVDTRTDVYALGVVLYRLLLKQYPYDVSGSTVEILRNIESQEPVRPRAVVSKFDSEVETLLLTALAKHPGDRYSSAAALHEDVRRWLDNLPLNAKSVSSIYLLRKIIARHRYPALVISLLTFIVLGFVLSVSVLGVRWKGELDAKEQTIEDLVAIRTYADGLERYITFQHALNCWRSGNIKTLNRLEDVLGKDSREGQSVAFLLKKERVLEKAPLFLQQLGSIDSLFGNYVVGEDYLQHGDPKRAFAHYQVGFNCEPGSRVDGLFRQDLRIRMTALAEQNNSQVDVNAPEGENNE